MHSRVSHMPKRETSEQISGYMGFHRVYGGWVYREWAPDAKQVVLAGDFNDWNWESHPMLSLGEGKWVLFLPGENPLWEGCEVRIRIDDVHEKTAFVPRSACRGKRSVGFAGARAVRFLKTR